MGGLCTSCRPQVPKDRQASIKHHGSILHRKTSISATFSYEPVSPRPEVPENTLQNGHLSIIPSTLDVNTATEEDLMTLPHIGRAIAHNIVTYRKQIGSFRVIEDLALVNGIGATKLEKLRKEIHVSNHFTRFKKLSTDSGNSSTHLVNLNSASVAQLAAVEHISEDLAAKIVNYRIENGKFFHLNDLVEPAALIDTTVLLKIKSFITIDNAHGRHSRNNSTASSKLRSTSYSSFSAFGPESLESNRAKVEPFIKMRFGRPVVRVATWNLQQCSIEKSTNPGVREVICATILEHGIKILAVQELADRDALQKLVDELNSPTLPNIQRLKPKPNAWKCAVSATAAGRMYQGMEYNGFIWDESANIELYSSALLLKPTDTQQFTRRPLLGYFKVQELDVVLVCVHLKAINPTAPAPDLSRLNEEICNIPLVVEELAKLIPEEKDIIVLGDFNLEPNEKEFDALRSSGFMSTVPYSKPTNISTKNMKGSRSYDNIWLNRSAGKLFTTNYRVVRSGLTNPWIPDGWSWGGVASDHCPVWAEFFVDKDFDVEAANKSVEGLKLRS